MWERQNSCGEIEIMITGEKREFEYSLYCKRLNDDNSRKCAVQHGTIKSCSFVPVYQRLCRKWKGKYF